MKFTVIASGSAGNCYVLEGRYSALILECGVRPERVFRETDIIPSRVAGCVISHEHHDHAGFATRYAGMGLRIFASGGTLLNTPLPRHARVVKLQPLITCSVGQFMIRPFPVEHDASEPMGFLIEHPECGRVLFVTDTTGIQYNFRKWRPDHILVEANYDDGIIVQKTLDGEIAPDRAARVRRTHMSILGALELIAANNTSALKTVTLIHLSDDNSDAEKFTTMASKTAEFAKIYVARPGLSFDMKSCEI